MFLLVWWRQRWSLSSFHKSIIFNKDEVSSHIITVEKCELKYFKRSISAHRWNNSSGCYSQLHRGHKCQTLKRHVWQKGAPSPPFSPYDGWVILYTINPFVCQLLMEILRLRMGWCSGFRSWQVTECHLASLLPVITEPVWNVMKTLIHTEV